MIDCTNLLKNFPIEIDYPGINNYSQFSFDGLGQNRKIIEAVSGSVTSTKQFVQSSGPRKEERDAGGNVSRRFFVLGQTISGSSYFYAKPHLDSISEMTDGSVVVQAQYAFDPFGTTTKLQGSLEADFQYAGYYMHQRSGLNLTSFRAYGAKIGRWISKDPLGEVAGLNLYQYVGNKPVDRRDPLGLIGGTAAGMTNAANTASSFSSATGKILCICTSRCKQQQEFQDVPGNTPFNFAFCMDNCIRSETTKVGDPSPGEEPMPGAPPPEGPQHHNPPTDDGSS